MAFIKTTDELKVYISIDVNLKFSKIKPSVDAAEIEFIKPLLGAAFYAKVLEAIAASEVEEEEEQEDLSPELIELIPYIQKTLALYAAFLSVEEMGVVVGDLGIQQQSNINSQPAPAWKVKDLKLKYLQAADKAADLLLEFLEVISIIPDGGTEDDRIFKTWYDDPLANTAISGCIVYKTSIANKYIDILDSRRLFLRLKKRILEIEARYVKRLICTDQYDEIIEQLKDNDLSDENKALCEKLEPVIAKRALYAVMPMLPVILSAEGLFLLSSNDSVIQKMQAGQTEKAAYMLQLKEGEHTGYESDEQALQTFLDENIDDYTLIKESKCWSGTTTATDEKWKIDNDPCNKGFSV